MNYRVVISLVLAALIAVFIFQNTAVVEFRLLFWTVAMSRSLMFFLLLGIGVALGWFLHGAVAAARRN